jgi:hypothetical protein
MIASAVTERRRSLASGMLNGPCARKCSCSSGLRIRYYCIRTERPSNGILRFAKYVFPSPILFVSTYNLPYGAVATSAPEPLGPAQAESGHRSRPQRLTPNNARLFLL